MRWLLILLFSATCQAAWNPDLWPSTNSAFKGRQRLAETISAMNERIQAAGWARLENQEYYGTNDGPGWFVQHTAPSLYLYGIKDKIKRLAPYYLDYRKAGGSGNFELWLASNATLPYLTASNLLAYAGAPSDWYDNTPWFNLNSSSNGYLLITNILNELRWTSDTPTLSTNCGYRIIYATSTNSYDYTITMAINDWIDPAHDNEPTEIYGLPNGSYCAVTIGYLGFGIWKWEYVGWRGPRDFIIDRSYAPTSIQARVEYYTKSDRIYTQFYTNYFAAMSDGIGQTNWQRYGVSTESAALSHTQQIGRLEPSSFVPPGDVEPTQGTNLIYYGWVLQSNATVIKWDGPNGFKYK